MTNIRALLAALCLAAPVQAHEVTVGDLQIIHPSIPQPAASAKAAGGFMTIANSGTEADRLIGIEAEFAARAETHESKVDENGVGTMQPVAFIDIAPGQTVELAHGGYHIMFMGLTGPLTEGEMKEAVLIFEKAGRVEIEFEVEAPMGAGMNGMDHSMMGSGD